MAILYFTVLPRIRAQACHALRCFHLSVGYVYLELLCLLQAYQARQQPKKNQKLPPGMRTQPSMSTRALRLMMALVTLHSPLTCVASAPTRKVPDG